MQKFNLRAWRTQRLGQMKATPDYQSLSPVHRRLVDKLVMRYESPDIGIIVKQENIGKLVDVSRQTANGYMKEIVAAGVFTKPDRQGRPGKQGGQTSERYRLNLPEVGQVESRLESRVESQPADTELDFEPDTQPDSGRSYRPEEVPSEQWKHPSRGASEAPSEHETEGLNPSGS